MLFEFIVEFADFVECFVELQAATENLQPQVVFLVYHHRYGFRSR